MVRLLLLLLLTVPTTILTGSRVGAAAAVVGADSPINFNLKSKLLSNALRDDGDGDDDDDDDNGGGGEKGQRLSNGGTLGKEGKTKKSSSGSSGGVSLDLSGRVDCCVLGGGGSGTNDGLTTVENPNYPGARTRSVTPLFRYGALRRRIRGRTGKGGHPLPSFFVGADYDFRKVWYGATRLVTTLAWSGAKNGEEGAGAGDNNRRAVGSHSHSRLGANLSFEKGLLQANDYSTKLEMILRHGPFTGRRLSKSTDNTPTTNDEDEDDNEDDGHTATSPKPSSISLRLDTLTSSPSSSSTTPIAIQGATVAGRTSLHPRLDLIARTTLLADDHGDKNASYLSHRVPPPTGGWSSEEGGWIPEVSVTPGGLLLSKNALGFRGVRCGGTASAGTEGSAGGVGSNDRWYDGMRTGVRLVVRRQLNWNALGLSMGAYDGGYAVDTSTFVRLELSGLDRACTTLRCVTLEAALERVRESAKVTLLLERVRTRQ